ncbi:uncharacterized protein J7T54_005948 [Emericellopsis cladophorae]|uniref:F-box domain-containing protein n=1 Tax=Emericellopsis cladophorae TaxID=2686198 RepID=A0A9Q0BIH1_9HYPO|nr:uncharacterized protein J7T54_005948 [Emericellopsis cladophorae]KAI6785614.1 hypothetical protein J7T54_005948 [Emericellopsis cladophorae]
MARTVTVPPIQTARLDMVPGSPVNKNLWAISEDAVDDMTETPDTPSSPMTNYPIYPGLQTFSGKVPGTPPPTALNSPRKLSNSSATTVSTIFSRESVRSELQRSSSWGSRTSIESLESSGQWKVTSGGYRVPQPLRRRRTNPLPNELFEALPGEVLQLILDNLKDAHLGGSKTNGEVSCATCWQRDLCSVALSSKRWCIYARAALYGDIQLVGSDSASHKKRFKNIQGARLLLLRRTLRSEPDLAAHVRSLKVPRLDTTAKGTTSKTLEQYDDLTATLVMACPNLERLHGHRTPYDHSHKKIFHALSTRAKLKQMDWVIEPSALQKQKGSQTRLANGLVMPGELSPVQEGAFLDHHRRWSELTSLSIHCLPGATITPDSLLTRALSMLPNLQQLHLCNLPPNAFNDATLLALPPLRTLSLTHITGISSSGLSSFATRPMSQSLQALHLRHTPLTSLATLTRILSNLSRLTSFSLAQAFPPLMPEVDSFTLCLMPYLASASLNKIHWDITSHRDCANAADDILARSIAAGGFPALRSLRAPNDPDAVFQQLCRPVERVDLPSDRFCASDMTTDRPPLPKSPSFESSPISPLQYLSFSPRTPSSPTTSGLEPIPLSCTNLRLARLAAQTRLEKARAHPKFGVVVTDEEGATVDTFQLGAYMGTVGSPIIYNLLPDAGSSDEKGGAVDMRDLMGDAGEVLSGGREGCTGAWNRREGVVADKKEKERWWHTERGRWTRIELQ